MKKQFSRLATTFISILLLVITAIAINDPSGQSGLVEAANTVAPTNGNLIVNPSIEQNTTAWNKDNWGSNTAVFAYNATGHNSAHSVTTTVSKYKSGDAKWYPTPVSVTPSTKYTFSDWYQSSVAGEVDAVVTTKTGATNYVWLATTPATSAWKQATVTFNTPANASKVTFYHVINKNGQLTVDDFDFRLATPTAPTTPTVPAPNPTPTPPPVVPPAPAPTAPTVGITSPANNATVKGAQSVTANVTDAKGIAKVQYKLDGNDLGTVTTAPYSLNWDTTKIANGSHKLTAIATNTANLSTTSSAVTVTVQNPTAPTISVTAPTAGSTVNGTKAATTVNTTDKQGIASIQYMLDGQPLGSPVTTAPYSFSWDTTKTTNGSHVLTAVATNVANLSTTSAPITVNVFNQVVIPTPPPAQNTGPNTIPNPSVETVDPAVPGEPQDWNADSWGTNTAAFAYLNTGHTGNRSTKVTLSNYTSGSADWSYTAQNVSTGHYRYTDWYQSDVTTEIDAAVTVNGVVQYYYLGTVLPSATWAQASAEFDIPAGATSITVFHLIAANGSLTTDDASFSTFTASPFNRGIVSLTFDDGWANQYTNALPLLNKYGQTGTFYIISGELNDQPDYMSVAQISSVIASGNELASHSITHPDLTTMSAAQAQQEMQQSQTTLQNTFGVAVTNFAYPFGAYNASTIAIGNQLYASQRTVDSGFNTKDNLSLSKLVVQNVFSTTTPAQIQAWVDQANQQHMWLILVFHEVANTPTDPTDADYTTKPADLDAELNYIKNSGITVKTVQQAINEVTPQL